MNKKAMAWATVLAAANLLSTFHEMHHPKPTIIQVPNLPHTPHSTWRFLAWLIGLEVVLAVSAIGVLWLSR